MYTQLKHKPFHLHGLCSLLSGLTRFLCSRTNFHRYLIHIFQAHFVSETKIFAYNHEKGYASINLKVESCVKSRKITLCWQTQQKRVRNWRSILEYSGLCSNVNPFLMRNVVVVWAKTRQPYIGIKLFYLGILMPRSY